MNLNLFSLVVASATGWAVLALGYLPVAVLRQHRIESLKAVAAWAFVAATAPPAIFHWYLIFALIGLVAWTKLDRPAGKVWLAIAASLGLSLGIIFPLEASPPLLLRENPWALASLYLGGAVAGLAYVVCVSAGRMDETERRPIGSAKWLFLLTLAWTVLLEEVLPRGSHSRELEFWGRSSAPSSWIEYWTPLVLASALVVITFLAFTASRRGAFTKMRWLAGVTALLALATSWLAQIVLRLSDSILSG
jgi:hypothetical protein